MDSRRTVVPFRHRQQQQPEQCEAYAVDMRGYWRVRAAPDTTEE